MTTRRRLMLRAQHGLTMIELLVALAVFAMFVLMIDAVFFSANRTARKVELAADVQQNARIAVERLTRELRESQVSQVVVDTSQGLGRHGIVFKSARLVGTPTVFCLYVRDADDPLGMRGTSSNGFACFDSFPGSTNDIPTPPYSGPPFPLCAPNMDTNVLAPCGTYTPIWQQYIGYYVAENPPFSSVFEMRRVSGQLTAPAAALSAGLLTGGDVVAVYVDAFNVTQTGSNFTVALEAEGTEVVQGTQVPAQQVKLPGGVMPRN